jgi:citrate synthase
MTMRPRSFLLGAALVLVCIVLYTSSDLSERSRREKESLREATRKIVSPQPTLIIARTKEARSSDGIQGEVDEREKEMIVRSDSRNDETKEGLKTETKEFDKKIEIATDHEVNSILSFSHFLIG